MKRPYVLFKRKIESKNIFFIVVVESGLLLIILDDNFIKMQSFFIQSNLELESSFLNK